MARSRTYLNPNLAAPYAHRILHSPTPYLWDQAAALRWAVSGREALPWNLALTLGRRLGSLGGHRAPGPWLQPQVRSNLLWALTRREKFLSSQVTPVRGFEP